MIYAPIIERNQSAEERQAVIYSTFPQGEWQGEKGDGLFMPSDLDAVPQRGFYSNMRGLTWRQIMQENGCASGIPYRDGEVDYDAMGCVVATVAFDGDKGIGAFLRPKGNGQERKYLHDEAFSRLAQDRGVTDDEVRVLKGDAEPVERLMAAWHCDEQSVWNLCGNPDRRQRVFHECADGRTVILVPRELHDNLAHFGGVEMYARAQEREAEQAG